MSTKNVQTAQFDPTGMSTYQGMQGGLGTAVNSYMNNPFSNPFFQTQQQMGMNQANMQGQTGMSNITRNIGMSGMQQNSPAALEMMNNQARSNSGMRAQLGFLNPMQNAFTAQQGAMGIAAGYKPLQTGQTQQQSGLGSWLPSLVGGGISALTGGLFGGGGGSAPQMSSMGTASFNQSSPFLQGNQGYNPFGSNPGMSFNQMSPNGYNMPSSPFAQ